MDKKTMRIAGWALGLALAVAGIGAAVGNTNSAIETRAGAEVFELYNGAISEGDYIFYYSGGAMKATVSSNRLNYESVTPSNDKITTADLSIVWHVASSGNYWTIYNDDAGKYAGSTSSKNQAALIASITDNAKWTVTGSSTYDFENLARSSGSDPNNKWLRKNGTYGFACYASGTGGALSLYKKTASGSNDPYISLNPSSISGYVGGSETITPTYDHLGGSLSWKTSNPAVATVDDGVVSFEGEGDATITAYDSADENNVYAECSVHVDNPSIVSVTLNKAETGLFLGETETLVAKVNRTGNLAQTVSWTSDNESVATVNQNGQVSTVAAGTATITATSTVDGSKSASCEVSVYPTASGNYAYSFGNDDPNTGTAISIESVYSTDNGTFSNESYAYGAASKALKLSSSSNQGSFKYTIDNSLYYIVAVRANVRAYSAADVTNGAAIGVTPDGGTQKTAVLTESNANYLFHFPADDSFPTSFVFASTVKRCFVTSLTVYYEQKPVELSADITSFDLNQEASQEVVLTPENFAGAVTYTKSIISGESLTVSSVDISNNVATITAGMATGTTVIRITATYNTTSAYVDLTVTVNESRTISTLTITTDPVKAFIEGDQFAVTGIVLYATFTAGEPVTYSSANGNLGLLTFSIAPGATLQTSDSGDVDVYVTAYGNTVKATYQIVVAEKTYVAKIGSADDLWDGQEVYFGNDSDVVIGAYSSGNSAPAHDGVYDISKGLCLNDSPNAAAYKVSRLKVDSTIYYAFSIGGHYISDNATEKDSKITTKTAVDDTCLWTIQITDGVAEITNKANTYRPNLQINSSSPRLSAYPNSQTNPTLYSVNAYDESAVASAFVDNYMHMTDDAYNGQGTGACQTSGAYDLAKKAYNAMSTDEKEAFFINEDDAVARLEWWAIYNGESFDAENGVFSVGHVMNPGSFSTASSMPLVVTVAALGAAGVAGFFFIQRKRKEF